MAKEKTIWLQLTPIEANAIMVMLDSEMEMVHVHGGIDLKEWETLHLEGYKLVAYRNYKKWYKENCEDC